MASHQVSIVGEGNGVSRRGFLKGVAGFGVAFGLGALADGAFFYGDAYAAADPGVTTTVPLPTSTTPEQVHLTWGEDPSASVTISWLAPVSFMIISSGALIAHDWSSS